MLYMRVFFRYFRRIHTRYYAIIDKFLIIVNHRRVNFTNGTNFICIRNDIRKFNRRWSFLIFRICSKNNNKFNKFPITIKITNKNFNLHFIMCFRVLQITIIATKPRTIIAISEFILKRRFFDWRVFDVFGQIIILFFKRQY